MTALMHQSQPYQQAQKARYHHRSPLATEVSAPAGIYCTAKEIELSDRHYRKRFTEGTPHSHALRSRPLVNAALRASTGMSECLLP